MPIMLRCHPGIGPAVTGTALVAKDNFSARYDLDRKAGIFSRPTHALAGQSYAGRILVLDQAKGGVATAWMLHEMKARGIVPLALVFNRVNPILAQGAAFGAVDDGRSLRGRRRHRPDPHRRHAAHRPGGGNRRDLAAPERLALRTDGNETTLRPEILGINALLGAPVYCNDEHVQRYRSMDLDLCEIPGAAPAFAGPVLRGALRRPPLASNLRYIALVRQRTVFLSSAQRRRANAES